MKHLPINPLSPEQQQKVMGQLYLLMGKQVQSYHKQRSMGSNTSVSQELARELMESMEYTLQQAGGIHSHTGVEEALHHGQKILEEKVSKAKALLELIQVTAPQWQTEGRWEALGVLRQYLDRYDHLHLAHRGPDELYYPILISAPEGTEGIDTALFYLNILWVENQIMAGVPEEVLDDLWDRLPVGTVNQCEHLLINGIGKALIGTGLVPLTFDSDEQMKLMVTMLTATEGMLKNGARLLCEWLDLKDENAKGYVQSVVPQLSMWIGENLRTGNIGNIFL